MKLNLHVPCDADREWIKAAAFAGGARCNEYAFANIVGWRDFFGNTVASVNGRIVYHPDLMVVKQCARLKAGIRL